ncbi:SDR family NAD(P)-dependent oxidoreductase [Arcanobacterium buesumense]|uniref:SDR family NAD(P)-dependent oxidoreductase n=1 Tax=Arcanobacterium buesumense TaxID=2722751 RepID=A0A6H2EL25_9ACTO|nr:SDR family NAD(P)-dependent oxidoreductase [Arcanobacterium buesumense]QJC21699.1 SDR family NAD(P)-dependent oxidoreductase [Arcanobacterium buesumense]
MTSAKVVIVTGASSGFGALVVEKLLSQGYIVYAAARRVERMAALEELGAKLLRMDVTCDDDVEQGVRRVIEAEGSIYGLVNNAGYGGFGMLENVSLAEAQRQFQVNVFGLMRITKAVLPYMRAAGEGRIVNVASVVGKVALPVSGWYSASKHAVEALSDSLRQEVKRFGIRVSIVEPGPVQTEFLDHAMDVVDSVDHDQVYVKQVAGFKRAFLLSYAHADGPERTANAIVAGIASVRPKIRYAVSGAKPIFALAGVMPTVVVDYLVNKAMGQK